MRILAPSGCKLGKPICSAEIEDAHSNRQPAPMLAASMKIPSVTLETDFVADSMAARLCTSLVGHVLFLKSQVPFPVMQLARMPGGDVATSRAAKKRQELLNSFDTLASHLNTTFTALSTAFALCSETSKEDTRVSGCAYLAVVLGPTPGSARSRVMVGVDALEAKVWGEREDHSGILPERRQGTDDHEVTRDSGDESNSDYDSDSDADSNECGDGGNSTGSDDEETVSESESDASSQAPSPPPSRTPSPSFSSPPSPPQPPSQSYAQELEALRTAERLLSRTLASACGENDGQGMASEIPPTQTHIVLRAPRRFIHPAWVPKQTLSGAFDALLDEFLEASGKHSSQDDVKKKKKGGKVEGVWIRGLKRVTEHAIKNESGEVPEEDEMIWWTWDGKLVGFADW